MLPIHARLDVRVPPIKTQGIKTKLIPLIASSIQWDGSGRWIEPFLGSGSVAFNLRPERAVLCDTNVHIIGFYQALQAGQITPAGVRQHLEQEGAQLLADGQHYYRVRERFNRTGEPLDFLFLNRACFNGVMRFNRNGKFNVPFCHKPDRFRPGYISKVVHQVDWVQRVIGDDWTFRVADWQTAMADLTEADFVYLDPPYVGRHADYYDSWTEQQADALATSLHDLDAGFAYSMWQENQYRRNDHLDRWFADYPSVTFDHYYHVGPTEKLRNKMVEAVVISPDHFARKPQDTEPPLIELACA